MKLQLLLLPLAPAVVLTGCAGFSIVNINNDSNISTHSVNLRWAASTSDVSGYNIYRAVYTDGCGSFSKINAGPVLQTSYTDSDVENGTSYCYAATTVNTSNEESGYSNLVKNVPIPDS